MWNIFLQTTWLSRHKVGNWFVLTHFFILGFSSSLLYLQHFTNETALKWAYITLDLILYQHNADQLTNERTNHQVSEWMCVNGEDCSSVGLYSVFSVFLVEWAQLSTVHSGQRGSSVHMNAGSGPSLLLLSLSFLFILFLFQTSLLFHRPSPLSSPAMSFHLCCCLMCRENLWQKAPMQTLTTVPLSRDLNQQPPSKETTSTTTTAAATAALTSPLLFPFSFLCLGPQDVLACSVRPAGGGQPSLHQPG